MKTKIRNALELDPKPNFSRIARKYRVSNTTVNRIADALGITAKGTGGLRISEEKHTEVLKLLPVGLSFSAVAAEVGVDPKTVAKIAAEKQEAERHSRQAAKARHLSAG